MQKSASTHLPLIAVLLLFPRFSINAGAAPSVLSVDPPPLAMVQNTQPEIVVRFDSPMDPESFGSHSMSVFGRWSGVALGQITFEDDNRTVRFITTTNFSAGELITVSLSKGVKNATGEAMVQGYAWQFMTAAGRGNLALQHIRTINVRRNGESKIRTYGAYAGDLNHDGYHDFTVPNEDADDVRVFLNDGAGNYGDFTIHALPNNSVPSTNEGADFNGDGLLDFAVGDIRGGTMGVFLGDGKGGFSPAVVYPTAAGTRGLAVLDLEGDGDPDIVTANRAGSNISILVNNGDGAFAPAANLDAGINGETSCAAADANGDGLLDLFVGGYDSREIAILLGDGEGNFSASTKIDCRGVAWMIAVGDVDGDRNVDVVSANGNLNQFAVLRGDGAGNLSAAEVYNTGAFSLAIDLGDLDGDGDLDAVTSNYSGSDFTLYENDGTGRFTNRRNLSAPQAGSCAVLHDRDRDGDLDMTGIDEEADVLLLFENTGAPTSVAESHTESSPREFSMLQSYPNPFAVSASNESAMTIPFVLHQPAKMKLELIDLQGRTMRILLQGELNAGSHHARVDLPHLPAGVYFYRLSSGHISQTRKMVLLP